MKQTYIGKLLLSPEYLDTAGVLHIGKGEKWEVWENPLAETMREDIKRYGEYLTVRYAVADTPLDEATAQTLPVTQYAGRGHARYDVYYDEWTDTEGEHFEYDGFVEELTLTDENRQWHDLLKGLKQHIGKYIYLEVEYRKSKEQHP